MREKCEANARQEGFRVFAAAAGGAVRYPGRYPGRGDRRAKIDPHLRLVGRREQETAMRRWLADLRCLTCRRGRAHTSVADAVAGCEEKGGDILEKEFEIEKIETGDGAANACDTGLIPRLAGDGAAGGDTRPADLYGGAAGVENQRPADSGRPLVAPTVGEPDGTSDGASLTLPPTPDGDGSAGGAEGTEGTVKPGSRLEFNLNSGSKENRKEKDRAAGRPRAYKKKYAEMAREFFEHPFFDPVQEVWYFPTVFRFAKKLGVCRKTLYNWMDLYPEFAEAIEDGNENAREMRIAFASCGKIDPKFAKFVLSADFGMKENQGIEIGSDGAKPFDVNIRIVE